MGNTTSNKKKIHHNTRSISPKKTKRRRVKKIHHRYTYYPEYIETPTRLHSSIDQYRTVNRRSPHLAYQNEIVRRNSNLEQRTSSSPAISSCPSYQSFAPIDPPPPYESIIRREEPIWPTPRSMVIESQERIARTIIEEQRQELEKFHI